MTNFVQAGDMVITAASDYAILSTYAARRQDGSLTILTINKDPVNTLTGLMAVAGFYPAANATLHSYGIPQDTAAQTGLGSPDVASAAFIVSGTNFSFAFAPYSATVLTFAPAPARLVALPGLATASQFVFQLQGQSGVPSVIQRSTNLVTWTAVSTNTPAIANLNLTNTVPPVCSTILAGGLDALKTSAWRVRGEYRSKQFRGKSSIA